MTEPALVGQWMATGSSGQVFAGTWAAVVVAQTPNQALGSWKVVDETGTKVLLKGTWSAQKRKAGGWVGTWKARVDGGGALSGKWEADPKTVVGATTFGEMLGLTHDKTVAGTWSMGHAHGNWWLKPLPPAR